jgi:CRISPR-associated protein Csb2
MIAIGIRYLTKYAVATNLARERAEWPVHPGRAFMAMAAAHFETGADPAERAALEWLEAAPAPALRASDADERTIVRTYVPVNDELRFKKKKQPPAGTVPRERAERAFPRTRPQEDCVYLIWAVEPAGETRAALGRVCSKVTRVGHSMSAVQVWVVPKGEEPEPNWLPGTTNQDARLRVPSAGTLRSLEIAFNGEAIQRYDTLAEALATATGREKTRLKNELQAQFGGERPESRRPRLVHWQGYGRPSAGEAQQPVFDGPFDEDFVVLTKLEGPTLGLESTLQLTGALRNHALQPAGKTSPEWLSGHDVAEVPSLHPHVAFFPLPYVGFEYADGHVLGLGMAVPRNLRLTCCATRDEELRRFLGPLFFDPDTGEERDIKLWKNGVWRWMLQREKRERPPLTLQRLSWTKPSRTWASVTPVVLHHHPKKRDGDIERIVREAFVSGLLLEPDSVGIRSVSAVQGAGHAMALPPFTEGGANLCRFQTHVVARFARAVRGPMLVGRGRFRGYGLFRPLPDGEAIPWEN